MPANLTPDYLAAEHDYRAAKTPAEKIEALERMFATIPKHKGTEKLQADIRHRLSQARKESQKKGAGHAAAPFYQVPRDGAGQVAMIGPPNSGKSRLVSALTHARPEVADFPFTTRAPTPGMMPFEDVQVQLVDLPPFAREFAEPWLPQAIRSADASVLVVDAQDPGVLDEVEFILAGLEQRRLPAPRLLAGNKGDLTGAEESFAALVELFPNRFPAAVPVSAASGLGLSRFAEAVFHLLGVVRFYSKRPGHKPDFNSPNLLRRGQTVEDAARQVHRDFADHFRCARLYHIDGGHDGLMVERSRLVEDRDILEFHT